VTDIIGLHERGFHVLYLASYLTNHSQQYALYANGCHPPKNCRYIQFQ